MCIAALFLHETSWAKSIQEEISGGTTQNDAVILAGPDGSILLSVNPEAKLIPASTQKILTSLLAIHTFGTDHRFKTEFYVDRHNNLKIKGFGDPFLISEVLSEIANRPVLRTREFNHIVLDDTYFLNPIIIPGAVGNSIQPYDAPNSALCVNFNTINFKRDAEGEFISAEAQTPLLPFVLKRIRASGEDSGRIILLRKNNEAILYAGHLMAWFFKNQGIQINGGIKTGKVNESEDKLLLTYRSRFSMENIIAGMLLYSNNFIANQILIAAGAKHWGAPGTLQKGVETVREHAERVLKIEGLSIAEGSGLSRKNRMSAAMLLKILEAFKPHRHLMRRQENEFYKTGTLSGIHTRAGYFEADDGRIFSYVIFINTPGKSTEPIRKKISALVLKLNQQNDF